MPTSVTFREHLNGGLAVANDLIDEMRDELFDKREEFVYNSEVDYLRELLEDLIEIGHEIAYLKQNKTKISFGDNLNRNYELLRREFEKLARSEANSLFNNMNLK